MPFGNGDGKERRKTSHVNENYRKYLKKVFSDALGIQLDDKQVATLQRLAFRAPLRFLMTLEEEDFDQFGERTLSVPNVGKFRIMYTVPQGRRTDLVGEEGQYPRYKFYPSANLEAEVEILNGIESEAGRGAYERVLALDEEGVKHTSRKLAGGKTSRLNKSSSESLTTLFQDFVKLVSMELEDAKDISTLKGSKSKVKPTVKSDIVVEDSEDLNDFEDSEDLAVVDTVDEDSDAIVEEKPKSKAKKSTTKAKTKQKESAPAEVTQLEVTEPEVIESEVTEPEVTEPEVTTNPTEFEAILSEPDKAPVSVSDVISSVIDDFDFDFNT